MNITKIHYVLILSLFFCCNKKNDFDILQSEIKILKIETEYSGRKTEYKIGQYKIDYSTKEQIKIYYSDNSTFSKPQRILLYRKDRYYDNFDLSKIDGLSQKSTIFLSKNPSDSYRIIEEISISNLEPPPPYFDISGKPFKYFDDSIIFKKSENLNLAYIKDNNLSKVQSAEFYYDNNYRIKKIVENIGGKIVIYK